MKNTKKDESLKSNESPKHDPVTPSTIMKEGGENSSFPQEYEEDLSTNIRMKPQPLEEKKKSEKKNSV